MKVQLHADGGMIVTAESSAEAYALQHWARVYFEKHPQKWVPVSICETLMVDAEWPRAAPPTFSTDQ